MLFLLPYIIRSGVGSLFVGVGDVLSPNRKLGLPFNQGDYSEGFDILDSDTQSDIGRFLASALVGNALTIGFVLGEIWSNPASRLPISVPVAPAIAAVSFVVGSAVVADTIVDTTYDHGGLPHLTSFTGQMSGNYFDY